MRADPSGGPTAQECAPSPPATGSQRRSGSAPPAQARAFMIADNGLTEIATWDDPLLAEQLRDLSLSGLDFDLEVTGFEVGEIALRIASLDDTSDVRRKCQGYGAASQVRN